MSGGSPEMSVVIVTPDRYETIRKTMEHLRVQTARHRLEIVIVAPSAARLALPGRELDDFCRVDIVEVARSHRSPMRTRRECGEQARRWSSSRRIIPSPRRAGPRP
jgi:hypothetical protein